MPCVCRGAEREDQQQPSTAAFVQQHLLSGLNFTALTAPALQCPKVTFTSTHKFVGKCDILVVPSHQAADAGADPAVLLRNAVMGFEVKKLIQESLIPKARLGFWLHAGRSYAPYMHVSADLEWCMSGTSGGWCEVLASAV